MGVGQVVERAVAYGVRGESVDGHNALEVYDVMHRAVQRAYNGEGASLIEMKVSRLTPHSSDDDDRTYRSREELEEAKKFDPLVQFAGELTERGLLNEEKRAALEARATQVVNDAQREAEALPYPDEATIYDFVYATEAD